MVPNEIIEQNAETSLNNIIIANRHDEEILLYNIY